jgi:hypothetical protein|tara:strand:- start:531 stop:734 length:204 start_codon:yes stop_codon:yes gene_type:complete
MALNEKILQEELAVLQADFDKTKKNVENLEKEVSTQRNNLNAIYGALQQTEKLYKLSKGESTDGKKV